MASMTHEFSRFPEQTYALHNFLNVAVAPDNLLDIIVEIKTYVANGAYADAERLLDEHKEELAQYWIDADVINAIEEEIRNLEIYARSTHQAYYYQDEEPDATEGDVWIE